MSRRRGGSADNLRCYKRDVRRFARLEKGEGECLVRRIEEGRQATEALAEPGLSPQRQRDLGERVERGRGARDRVVEANLRLVIRIAERYSRRGNFHGLELLDLIQEGNIGLIMAVDNLKSGYGKISAYVAPWIRRRIHRAVAEQSRIIRTPQKVRGKLDRLRREESWYLSEKGRPPTPEELAAELGVDPDGLEALRQAEREVVSLEDPLSDDETGTVGDLVEDPEGEAFVRRTTDRQWLAWLLTGVSDRGRRIAEWHFGLGLTLDEIGRREGLSRERVRQIAREALEKPRRRVV